MIEGAKQIVDAFSALPIQERSSALLKVIQSCVPQEFRGFFVDRSASLSAQRREVLFEIDGLINAQSLGFAADMLPLMYPHLETLRGNGNYLEALDVGSRTGAGAAFFAELFMSYHSDLPTYVDTIDLDATFIDYQKARWPRLRKVLLGDIFELSEKCYDFVICSHTIEHLTDPGPFCRQLQRIARKFVFIYCPYEENNPIPEHYTINESFVESLSPISKSVFKSWWARFDADRKPHDCVFFVLPPS